MFIYWLMFIVPVLALLSPVRLVSPTRHLPLLVVCFLFVLIIGLRYQVGGDWIGYLEHYQAVVDQSFSNSINIGDPGYALLVWLSASIGLGIYAVNLTCAVLVMTGVYYFCRFQPQPWLALITAVPYFLIVVAMGYTRQSVAISFELLALIALTENRLRRFFLFILFAGLFHKSAVLLLPLAILSVKGTKIWIFISMLGMSILITMALLVEHYEYLIVNYVDAKMQSEGAFIRIAMNAVPAALFLRYSKLFSPNANERRIWTLISIFSLICIPFVSLASTAVDRVALYFLPIQLFVYSRIERIFHYSTNRQLAKLIIIIIYGLVQWVMLNIAPIVSIWWVPYHNVIDLWLGETIVVWTRF
jgi:hypothetical protein